MSLAKPPLHCSVLIGRCLFLDQLQVKHDKGDGVVVNDDNTSDNYSDKNTEKNKKKLQNELPPDDQSECSRGLVMHSYSPFTQCLCTAQCTHCALQ